MKAKMNPNGGSAFAAAVAKCIVEEEHPEYEVLKAKLAAYEEHYQQYKDHINVCMRCKTPCDSSCIPLKCVIDHDDNVDEVCNRVVSCGRSWCPINTAPYCTCGDLACELDTPCVICDVVKCMDCMRHCDFCGDAFCYVHAPQIEDGSMNCVACTEEDNCVRETTKRLHEDDKHAPELDMSCSVCDALSISISRANDPELWRVRSEVRAGERKRHKAGE